MRRRRAGLDAEQALDERQMTPARGNTEYDRAGGYDRAGYAGREAYGNRDPYGNSDPYLAGAQHGPGQYGGGGRHRAASHASGQRAVKQHEADRAVKADQRITRLSWLSALALGASQILALLPGISRDGSVMVAGLVRGLSRQDAARFSFLLSAPVIFAAGVFKASELLGSETAGIRGQILVGSIISGIGAYLALRFLDKYLSNPRRTLTPFAVYCLVMGIGSALYLGIG